MYNLKDKIIFTIWYLIRQKTFTYIAIWLITLIMWYIWIQNYISYKISVAEHDIKVRLFIDSKVSELKPLETQEQELKLKIDPLKSCIEWAKKTLWTTEIYDCNKQNVLIPKANADDDIIPSVLKKSKDDITMERICTYATINWKVSPLCNNQTLYDKLKWISEKKWVDFYLMLWIAQAESHIGANYAPWCWPEYNNLWGIKWKKLDDWTNVKDQPIPDKNWCWLYKFASIEDYWTSKANSLKIGYIDKWATTPEQISKYYVRWDWIVKTSWSNRVRIFYEF